MKPNGLQPWNLHNLYCHTKYVSTILNFFLMWWTETLLYYPFRFSRNFFDKLLQWLTSQFYIQLVYKTTFSLTLRIQIVSGVIFEIFIFILEQKYILSNFLVRTQQYLKKKKTLLMKSWKKSSSKAKRALSCDICLCFGQTDSRGLLSQNTPISKDFSIESVLFSGLLRWL